MRMEFCTIASGSKNAGHQIENIVPSSFGGIFYRKEPPGSVSPTALIIHDFKAVFQPYFTILRAST